MDQVQVPVFQRVTCVYCDKTYRATSLRRHMRTIHRIDVENVRKNMECLDCSQKFSQRNKLINHLKTEHQKEIEKITRTFNSNEDFETWLEEEERSTCSKYIKPWGEKKTVNGSVVSLICSRDKQVHGCITEKNNRQRALKSQGSRKCSNVCTSHLVVNKLLLPESKVVVKFVRTHYGHEKEVQHLQLSKTDKDTIADQLLMGVNESRILRNAIEATNEAVPSRMDTLNRKDIANIRTAYGIGLFEGRRHTNDVLSVDLWVAEELEKIEKLRSLLLEQDRITFDRKLTEFQEDLKKPEYSDYEKYWNDSYKNNVTEWAYAYRSGAPVTINMHLKSSHKTVENFHFGGKQVRRLDESITGLYNFLQSSLTNRKRLECNLRPPKKSQTIYQAHKKSNEPNLKIIEVVNENYLVQNEKYHAKPRTAKSVRVADQIIRSLYAEIREPLQNMDNVRSGNKNQMIKYFKAIRQLLKGNFPSVKKSTGTTVGRKKRIQKQEIYRLKLKKDKRNKTNITSTDVAFQSELEIRNYEPCLDNAVDHEEVVG